METTIDKMKVLDDNFTPNDKYWIKKAQGLQLLEVKYPTYGEHTIDSQIKLEITYENLISDINSVLDVLTQYENLYKSLITENKNNICKVFTDHNLKYQYYGIHAHVLHREIVLILLKLKTVYEGDTKGVWLIERDYHISDDGYVNAILDSESIQQLEKRNELVEAIAYIKVLKRNEEMLLSFEHKPSIGSMSILLKYLKNVIESICIIILSLEVDDCHRDLDDLLLDLFHNVSMRD
jgi:hypothetical protein